MRRVIGHPLCDRGTALLVYWRGAPGFYAQFADRSETRNPDQSNHYGLLREIEHRIIAGHFCTHRFHYDPENDRGHDMTTKYSGITQKRPIPPVMLA